MDSELVWQDRYNIGVEAIDREHQRLFRIINRLLAYGEDKGQWACQEGIKYFKAHAVKHFDDEEEYTASIGYEGLATHRKIHQGFRNGTLPALERELQATNYSPDAVKHFLGVCSGWLIGHTLTEDQAITGSSTSKWENLLSKDKMAALTKIITQLLFNMFRLESEVVSDTYAGERFGQGAYFRLIYEEGEKSQEVILVLEEKLMVSTVGGILGLQTSKLDMMLINAVRYTARQFVDQVLDFFPDVPRKFKAENLLSYEQLQRVFQTKKPQVSLLFNTGAGYFAYCSISPAQEESVTVTPIEADNAIEEVERYLADREKEAQKPKVLVVDDSSTLREAMRALLETDYEVSLADSGVAAIRAITLDRPDLILLDYEMPVCDGRQTLEMLRSEQSFDSIPVIFLTGRDDPNVVRKLLSLKPAGYLLKYLKPAEIKKKIDDIFEKLG